MNCVVIVIAVTSSNEPVRIRISFARIRNSISITIARGAILDVNKIFDAITVAVINTDE